MARGSHVKTTDNEIWIPGKASETDFSSFLFSPPKKQVIRPSCKPTNVWNPRPWQLATNHLLLTYEREKSPLGQSLATGSSATVQPVVADALLQHTSGINNTIPTKTKHLSNKQKRLLVPYTHTPLPLTTGSGSKTELESTTYIRTRGQHLYTLFRKAKVKQVSNTFSRLPKKRPMMSVFSKRALFLLDNMVLIFLWPGSLPVYKQWEGMRCLAIFKEKLNGKRCHEMSRPSLSQNWLCKKK